MAVARSPEHTPSTLDRTQRAIGLAADLLRAARAGQTAGERGQAGKLARMMADPHGKELTLALVDQAFRSHRPARTADQLRYLLGRHGVPRYLATWERAGLGLGAIVSRYLPDLVVAPILAQLRRETRAVIVPGEEDDLRRYLRERRASGTRLNLNLLGEAIIGETEARHRLDAYLALLARDDVEYISVKISSVFSQINLVAFRQTVEQIKDRLRPLYQQALRLRYRQPDGTVTPKFINLDMEEYRDLDLTVAAFCELLDEPELLPLSAGLVLQAYLPDAHRVQQKLTAWAMDRRRRGGAPIKVRIVKGANLAMERVEASVMGWPQAPYTTKLEVDANYKRMVEYGCRPERAQAVHLGVASHNLFDIAYALILRDKHRVGPWVELEMLEGMANHQARAVQERAGGLLLYAPVVKAEDLHSAIAYLVRRLDENTAEQNFLRHLFDLEPGSEAWRHESERFLASYRASTTVSSDRRRTQDRRAETTGLSLVRDPNAPFANEPDTDWALPANRAWIAETVARWRVAEPEPIPLQIGGALVDGAATGRGIDPSRPGRVAYRYALADRAQVDRALDVARQAQADWAASSIAERRALLDRCATELGRRRGDLIGAMILDTAKTVQEADPEVSEAIDFARYYARALDPTNIGADMADCQMEPLGTVVVTPPWNFPLAIPAGGVLAALMAGNCVILKPAQEAMLVGWYLAQTLWAAGVPKDVLQFVPCPDDEVGRALVTDPRVGGVILTGSAETARLFLGWQPDLRLFAETSGKGSLVVTALADRDQAIKDLVRSAFGHNGQKCSAASLAICEAEVYDDPTFLRQLWDAVASLPVGSAWDLSSKITPLTQPPGDKLRRALTTLEEGETWLLEPRQIGDNPQLWSPGIKLGVRPGSFFHQTEVFGPVLGLMRAASLDDAIRLANDTAFGLTAGIHSLDDREVERWCEEMEAGNLYVNRHTTGAIVRRQPFGGWKGSSVGPGAKAGGPNYVLQLAHWQQVGLPEADSAGSPLANLAGTPTGSALLRNCLAQAMDADDAAILRASAASYDRAWQSHFGREHDPSQILGEQNVFRYRPCRLVTVRCDPTQPERGRALCQIVLAAEACGTPLDISVPMGAEIWPWLAQGPGQIHHESEDALAARLRTGQAGERLRIFEPVSDEVRVAAHGGGVDIVDAAVLANGRLELRWYLREQAVSRVTHRYGNVVEPPTLQH
jgi:RHH-type proline utilization regulon transcriptional repressor/proline dehydrogenase/delta 1-pyrroline-5-carboxylate dehydrogenase